MNFTEQEAKTKWCPQVRFIPNNEGGPSNRHSPDDGGADDKNMVLNPAYARCIGSACMMWEWADEYPDFIEISVHDPRCESKRDTFADAWFAIERTKDGHSYICTRPAGARRGTCGLIRGKP